MPLKPHTMKIAKLFILSFCSLTIYSCNNSSQTSSEKKGSIQNELSPTEVLVIDPTTSTDGKIEGVSGGCGYNYTPQQKTIDISAPRQRELNQINSILKFSGLTSNFKIYSANIDNAVATIIGNKRYILYDPRLLSYTDQQSGNYWTSMSILAHEIGHHLSGHTITNKGSNPHDELEADKYSGFILYKLGATLPQATAAIQSLGSETASTTHPSKSDRIKAISTGWNEANQTRYNGAIPPPPNDNPSDFYTYNYRMLVSEENLKDEFAIIHEADYEAYDYFYGVVTEVTLKDKQVELIKVYVNRTGKNWRTSVGNLDGETIDISLDDYWKAPDNCMACGRNLPSLLTPGRRLRFAFVEGLSGGTAENGWLRLTYAQALNGSTF